MTAPTVGVVTVTYNSDLFFDTYMQSLEQQTQPPDRVVLVDSGSSEPAFLDRVSRFQVAAEVVCETNLGFAAGSNVGWRLVRHLDYILFLNPDAFLPPEFLATAIAFLETHSDVGMVTPSLVRYDMATAQPLDIVDTTGVVRNRLGLLVERDQGRPVSSLAQYSGPNDIPWACAAVVLVRRAALDAVVEAGDQLFDESFFMYKEDTDLAWRVRRAGWRIVHLPGLVGYHCRGWQSRKTMSRRMRLMTARNEIKMCLKNRSPFVAVALVKYLVVFLFDY